MAHLELLFLGPPLVKLDGRPIKMERQKATALLAYLAATGGPHTRDSLATLLWPESSQAHARTDLRKALLVLRQALGGEWFEAEQEWLGLKGGTALRVDFVQFDDLAKRCAEHRHTGDDLCPACITTLAEAVALYRGDFMAGFSLRNSMEFDDWERLQSERLRHMLGGMLERLACAYSRRREHDEAILCAQRWAALDPLNEPAQRLAMQVYFQADRRAAALQQYHDYVGMLQEEMGLSPEEETRRLCRAIQSAAAPVNRHDLTPAPTRHTLPLQPTPFVGREQELQLIAERLRDPTCRMLTLVGPGGVGKTRLALQAATAPTGLFRHGAHFIPLVAVNETDLIVLALAGALRLPLHSEASPKTQWLDYLADKEMLLVLDNFEHLLDGAGLLAETLSSVPGVKLLVTSRQRLNLHWEWPINIKGLEFPQTGESRELSAYSAGRLFLQTAARAYPDFALAKDDEPSIKRICRDLEGLPLGIELAAAWVEVLSCHEIAMRIEDHLETLNTTLPEVALRHRSLWATFDQSWELLSDTERSAFKRLSVFHGGFEREAAERVAGASLSQLSALMHKSLLRRSAGGQYEMLYVLQQYADARLRESPEEWQEVRRRHCAYYLDFLARQQPAIKTPKEKDALEAITGVMENAREAWRWAAFHGEREAIAQSMPALYTFYNRRCWFEAGEQAMAQAVAGLRETAEDDERTCLVLGQVLARQAWFCQGMARFEEAQQLLEQSLALFRRSGALDQIAHPLNSLAVIAGKSGRYAEAQRLLGESLAIYRQTGNLSGVATCLGNMGTAAWKAGDQTEAERCFGEALALAQETGNPWDIAAGYNGLGLVAEATGNYAEAERLQRQGLAIFRQIEDRQSVAESLGHLGFTLFAQERLQEAEQAFREAMETALASQAPPEALRALVGIAMILARAGSKETAAAAAAHVIGHPANYPGNHDRAMRLLADLATQMSPEALAAAQERGRTLSLDEIVQMTMDICET